jgi:hydroxyacylglutathione hydrolase
MKIKTFTFNLFSENTFVIYDQTKECVIIDPGCYEQFEKDKLEKYILENNLKPVMLINTHCHIDHILGNKFVSKRWGLDLLINKLDLNLLNNSKEIAQLYGFTNYEISPDPKKFLDEGGKINFGTSSLSILFTPGHAPGHISLYSKKENLVISGDVLFQNSIGRTDLPGGNYEVLIDSIKTKLLVMEDSTKVFCGHGPSTTIGNEKLHNPFLK